MLSIDFIPEKNALVLKHMSSHFEFSEAQPSPENHMIIHIKLKNAASYTFYGISKYLVIKNRAILKTIRLMNNLMFWG